VGADAFGIARASAHRVKWSVSTSIQVFPLADNGMGPTRSTATTCHGRPAYSRRRPVVSVGRPCLLAWQTSHCRMRSRTSRVNPGQCQRSLRHLMIRLTPEWACLWVSQIISRRRARGHTTRFPSRRLSAASVMVRRPSWLTLREPQRIQRCRYSTSPCCCCSSVGRRPSFLAGRCQLLPLAVFAEAGSTP